MKKLFEKTAYWVGVLTLGVIVGITIKVVGAWVEPNQLPPGGNIAAPLNTGNIGQSKQGGLTLNVGGAIYGLIVDKGLAGIGTTAPGEKLEVNGNIKLSGNNTGNPAFKITNVISPTDNSDVATKGYVDAAVGSRPYPREIETSNNASSTITVAIEKCRSLGEGWVLPTQEELAVFIGSAGATNDALLTRTPSRLTPSLTFRYYSLRLSDGFLTDREYTETGPFRCVKF